MLASSALLYEQLSDPTVSEIHIIGPSRIIVKRRGVNEALSTGFESNDAIIHWLDSLLTESGQATIDTAVPIREFHRDIVLRNCTQRSRIHVVLPPLSPVPVVTVAKQVLTGVPLSELVSNGTLTFDAADFLEQCIQHHINILIAGGAGSGKTTLMSCLLNLIPEHETLGIIEEMPELVVAHENTTYLYNRAIPSPDKHVHLEVLAGALVGWAEQVVSAGEIGKSELTIQNFLLSLGQQALHTTGLTTEPVTLARLVKESLRMRLDRIALGEVRGEEALDLLAAMNTGALGSTGTIHSNSALETIKRLQTAASMSGMPPAYVLDLIAQAIDIIVYLAPPAGGQHGVAEIIEVSNRVVNGTTITTQPLYRREKNDLLHVSQPSQALVQRLSI
jgi:pilus assembly protein CpaF